MRICSTHGIAYVREPLILLDNLPTPLGRLSWKRCMIVRRNVFASLYRMAANRQELRRFLAARRRFTNLHGLRLLVGRLFHRKGRLFLEGLGLTRDVFVRLPQLNYRLDHR